MAALVVGGIGGPSGASGSPAGTPAAPGGSSLTLLAPPTVAEPTTPFALRLGVPAGSRTGLSLVVTVYDPVHDTTEFDDTLAGSPVGSSASGPFTVPLASVPPDTADPQGGVDLVAPVTAAGTTSPGAGPFTVDLHCPL
ncbi:MAG TPA: hypothetical protein VMF60_10560, partial [Acidimicrobiales bacterium]|nr:hypothetical protein [Acidimicrobiales bacterium]